MNDLVVLLLKDAWSLRNLRRLAQEQSSFKVAFILCFAALMLAGLWWVFLDGFRTLDTLGGIGLMLVHHLFALFFFGLALMLVVSNIITAYTTLFRSEEVDFLMTRPASHGAVTLHQWLETAGLSSWAFFFIIIPFIGAYAWHQKLSPLFSVWTFLFSIPFVLLCAEVGLLITLCAVRWTPKVRPWVWSVVLAAGAAMLFLPQAGRNSAPAPDELTFILSQLAPGLRLASHPLWPSGWVAEGIMAMSKNQWGRGLWFLGVLTAQVLMGAVIIEQLGHQWLGEARQRALATQRRGRRRISLFTPLDTLVRPLPSDMRALISKDIRAFLRDPVQWSQALIFFGLLGIYFFNLRNLHYHQLLPVWRNLIVFLNIFSLSAVMCSYCSRFVYPQLSLEGQGFWLVGLSPTTMGRVLLAKAGLWLMGMVLISGTLMTVSTWMLGVDWTVRLSALAVALAMPFALCGLSMGLGALFLDLKQRNPTAIVSGFGGTLTLALSLLYMMLSVLPFGLLFHGAVAHYYSAHTVRLVLPFLYLWLVALTLVTGLVPMILGRNSLKHREY